MTKENFRNISQGIERIKKTGAQYVRLAAMQSTEGVDAYGEEDWKWAVRAGIGAEFYSDKHFKVYNLMEGVVGERPDYQFCGFQHFVIYVGANLECYRCCYTAYTDRGLVGSLTTQTLKEYVATRDLTFDAQDVQSLPAQTKKTE